MGRRNRKEIEHEGAIYHIIIKGIEGTDIFSDDVDRNKFLKLLGEMSNSFKVHIFSYTLMGTHSHLLLKTEEANLSQAMQFLNSSYAHWFNIRHIRKGHLFQDRYKSHLILNPKYLFSVASYISLNPVEVGFVDSPEEYPWSSFKYITSPQDTPPWLKMTEFLELCFISADKFANFVKENMLEKSKAISFKEFEEIERVQNNLPKNLENILKKARQTIGDFKINKHVRNLLIYLLVKGNYRTRDIANSFNITTQHVLSISKKTEKNLMIDPLYRFWLKNIKTYI